jgi:hypothetical protein
MKGLRLSILPSMIVTLFIAVGLTAFRSGSDDWFRSLYTIAVSILFLTAMVAKFSRGAVSAFWLGFSAFGWCFLFLGFGLSNRSELDMDGFSDQELVSNSLITTPLIKRAFILSTATPPVSEVGKYGYSIGIGHLIVTFLLAPIAGFVALALYRHGLRSDGRGASRSPKPAAPPPSDRIRRGIATVAGVSIITFVGLYALRFYPYFPDEAFSTDRAADSNLNRTFAKYLNAMGEAPIWRTAPFPEEIEVYRFIRLHTRKPAICVRAEKNSDSASLRIVALDSLKSESPGVIAIDQTIRITRRQWENLVRQVSDAGFWSMEREKLVAPQTFASNDLLEGVRSRRHHLVHRYAYHSTSLSRILDSMLTLSGVRIRGASLVEAVGQSSGPDPLRGSGESSPSEEPPSRTHPSSRLRTRRESSCSANPARRSVGNLGRRKRATGSGVPGERSLDAITTSVRPRPDEHLYRVHGVTASRKP